jgi:hypothetical protein
VPAPPVQARPRPTRRRKERPQTAAPVAAARPVPSPPRINAQLVKEAVILDALLSRPRSLRRY